MCVARIALAPCRRGMVRFELSRAALKFLGPTFPSAWNRDLRDFCRSYRLFRSGWVADIAGVGEGVGAILRAEDGHGDADGCHRPSTLRAAALRSRAFSSVAKAFSIGLKSGE